MVGKDYYIVAIFNTFAPFELEQKFTPHSNN